MRAYIAISLVFIVFSAQAQYSIDWSKAPLNPLPEQYTLNHFKISGDVESWTDVYSKTITTFNRQGKALTQKSETDQTVWVYDSNGNLSQQLWGEDLALMAQYETDEKGFITAIIRGEGNVQTINYNEEGLFLSKMEGDVPVVKYAYDDQGRVVQEEFFYNGEPSMLAVYEYTESRSGLIVKTTHINRNTNDIESYTQQFNKSGDMILRNNTTHDYVYDKQGNILSSWGKDFPVKYEYIYATYAKTRMK